MSVYTSKAPRVIKLLALKDVRILQRPRGIIIWPNRFRDLSECSRSLLCVERDHISLFSPNVCVEEKRGCTY